MVGDLTLDEDSHEVSRGGDEIQLTATEFELLRYLMRNPRRVLSKAQILDRVWNYDFGGQANVVELYISYLRKKIDAGRAPMIHTLRGAGYVLAASRDMSQSGQPAPAFVAAPASVPTAGVPRTPEPLPRPNPFGRHTLGRQLVVRVTALVALAALLITTATALAARQLLWSQLDGQLDTVTARVRGSGQCLAYWRSRHRLAPPRSAHRHAGRALRQ